MELPGSGVTLDYNGRLYFTRSGCFHVRAIYRTGTGKAVYSGWASLRVQYHGSDADEIDFTDPPQVEADENTVFVIRSSYTGLVGAEPDRIEKPSEPEPVGISEFPEEHPAHRRLIVDVYDGTGKQINAAYIWEADGSEGIKLAPDGTVSFTGAGAYRVRVRSGEFVSDWFWIDAVTESEEYSTVSFLDDDGSVIKIICLPWGTALEPPAVPERDGYTFAGWSPALPDRVPADDLSLTAVWVKAQAPADKDTDGKSRNPATGNSAAAAAAAAAAAIIGAAAAVRRRSPRKH